MTIEVFNKLVDYIVVKRIVAVMCTKSAEYASGNDKLHNFKRAGRMKDCTAIEASRGMKLKHEVSIQDMLDALNDPEHIEYTRELWEEKFTDDINYRILQWALLAEKYGWEI